MWECVIAYQAAIMSVEEDKRRLEAERREHEEFTAYIETLPPHEALAAIRTRAAVKAEMEREWEKRQIQATEERRHRELCDAIREGRRSYSGSSSARRSCYNTPASSSSFTSSDSGLGTLGFVLGAAALASTFGDS